MHDLDRGTLGAAPDMLTEKKRALVQVGVRLALVLSICLLGWIAPPNIPIDLFVAAALILNLFVWPVRS